MHKYSYLPCLSAPQPLTKHLLLESFSGFHEEEGRHAAWTLLLNFKALLNFRMIISLSWVLLSYTRLLFQMA